MGSRKVVDIPIRFVPELTSYDDDPGSSNSFSLFLNLSETPEVKIAKSRNNSEEGVTEKNYKKEVQVKHTVKKFCSGNAEAYLK